MCRYCCGFIWDVFYVAVNDATSSVKFGVTSGDPSKRLQKHAQNGYRRVIRLLTDLPGDTAPQMERALIAALRLAREAPIRGWEYYNATATATILEIVDGYPVHTKEA